MDGILQGATYFIIALVLLAGAAIVLSVLGIIGSLYLIVKRRRLGRPITTPIIFLSVSLLVIGSAAVYLYEVNQPQSQSHSDYSSLTFTVYTPTNLPEKYSDATESGAVLSSSDSTQPSYVEYALGTSGTLLETQSDTALVAGLIIPPEKCPISYFDAAYLRHSTIIPSAAQDTCVNMAKTTTGTQVYGDIAQPDYAMMTLGDTLILVKMDGLNEHIGDVTSILNNLKPMPR